MSLNISDEKECTLIPKIRFCDIFSLPCDLSNAVNSPILCLPFVVGSEVNRDEVSTVPLVPFMLTRLRPASLGKGKFEVLLLKLLSFSLSSSLLLLLLVPIGVMCGVEGGRLAWDALGKKLPHKRTTVIATQFLLQQHVPLTFLLLFPLFCGLLNNMLLTLLGPDMGKGWKRANEMHCVISCRQGIKKREI
jgi:hypothetical protein